MKIKSAKKTALTLFAAVAMSAVAAEFGVEERNALHDVSEQAKARIAGAAALDGNTITILPVRGDRDGYFGGLLLNAFVNAGKTCVISNDDINDARFRRILAEIKWDERQTTLKSIDPATADELGRLKSTQILVEAVVDLFKAGESQYGAELNMLAYAVETKQYVWSDSIRCMPTQPPPPPNPTAYEAGHTTPSPSSIRVNVVSADGDAEIVKDKVAFALCNAFSDVGYVVNGKEPPDVVVSVSAVRNEFDKSGDYVVYDGTLRMVARAAGSIPRFLGEKTVHGRGKRGLGEVEAEKKLADELAKGAGEWARGSFKDCELGIRVAMVTLEIGRAVKSVEDLELQGNFHDAAVAEKGVRSVRLLSHDPDKGEFVFRVVFDRECFTDGFLNTMMLRNPEWKLGCSEN